ncbi:3-dehydroquinate dehydratase [Cenarchaeum symbiosum A]|uniref:3-dehydroquinate dehydratase n=1 Tax=Cenarchaeum symbiosum (strain A) TaxID=414004 RepID=A0RU28_CENSY|nr:3-dehydroquinate dehydratase [Cenarchaeum symbiosum A]
MRYSTCVSIAEEGPAEMAKALRTALKKSDYAELRLDYLEPEDVPKMLKKAGTMLGHCICTLRPRIEGGRFPGTEKERRDILADISRYKPYLVDVEYDTIRKSPALRRRLGRKVLVSWHDFKGTPQTGMLRRRLRAMSAYSTHVKMVCTAKKPADSSRMLALYSDAGRTKLVAFAMGEQGKMSRLLCLYLGSPFTYVYVSRPTALGQFGLKEIGRYIA